MTLFIFLINLPFVPHRWTIPFSPVAAPETAAETQKVALSSTPTGSKRITSTPSWSWRWRRPGRKIKRGTAKVPPLRWRRPTLWVQNWWQLVRTVAAATWQSRTLPDRPRTLRRARAFSGIIASWTLMGTTVGTIRKRAVKKGKNSSHPLRLSAALAWWTSLMKMTILTLSCWTLQAITRTIGPQPFQNSWTRMPTRLTPCSTAVACHAHPRPQLIALRATTWTWAFPPSQTWSFSMVFPAWGPARSITPSKNMNTWTICFTFNCLVIPASLRGVTRGRASWSHWLAFRSPSQSPLPLLQTISCWRKPWNCLWWNLWKFDEISADSARK